MLLTVPFLTQYRGSTKQTPRIHDRFGWAKLEVRLEQFSASGFTPVLRRHSARDVVYHDGSHFWVEINSTNGYVRGAVGSYDSWQTISLGTGKDLRNFAQQERESFFWNAFGSKLFDRLPVGHYHSLGTYGMKNYRPGEFIEWDDTESVTAKYAKFIADNLLIVDGVVLCRIERPCFAPHPEDTKSAATVFTPYGGYGDPVLNFAALQEASYHERMMERAGWRWVVSPDELRSLDDEATDPYARSVRAAHMGLFVQKSWLSAQKNITKSKAAKKFVALHALWKANGTSVDEAHLDEAADILIKIAEPGPVLAALEAWQDRPVSL